MAAVKGRKHNAGRSGRDALLRGYVRQETSGTADEIATRLGISLSAYLDLALEHAQRDLSDDGVPTWWPQEQLPMTG
jgi:hypothetical protein